MSIGLGAGLEAGPGAGTGFGTGFGTRARRGSSLAEGLRAGLVALVVLAPAGVLAQGARGAEDGEAAGAGDAAELLRRFERHQAGLRTLTANFTQTYRSEATGESIVEKGRLFVERPRLRFDYRRPDRKVFLIESDGTTLAYVPADHSAVRARLPEDAPHLDLLRGRGDLLESFRVERVVLRDPAVAGSQHLKLTPRRALAAIETVYLELSRDSRSLHRVLVLDALGNESDLLLERTRENADLRSDTFRLELPSGVRLRDLVEAADAPAPAGATAGSVPAGASHD